MPEQAPHGMLPQTNHDEHARQDFVKTMRAHVTSNVTPGNRIVYDTHAEPLFVREHNRPPETRNEVRKAMLKEPYHQVWSALLRTTQELIWDSVGESVERQWDDLIAKAKKNGKRKLGSLTLDPKLQIPRYLTAVDIHCMPGNYTTELREDDVFAGALYDRGVHVYMIGGLGEHNQGCGDMITAHVKNTWPEMKPKRILDIGCSVGHSTLPYCDVFPEAEIHGIDLGAPMLRYAHARAESLGKAVHFSQQNAEFTNFEDRSFDLIVSHIMLHETSNRAVRNIMKECRRLLKPGGVTLHLEVPPYDTMDDVYSAYLRDWDTHYNAEPFIGGVHSIDLKELMSEAGFADDEIIVEFFSRAVVNDPIQGNPSHHTGGTSCLHGGIRKH